MYRRSPHAPALILLATLALFLVPGHARATVVPMGFAALAKSADSVVVATVIGSSSHYAGESSQFKGLIVTDTNFEITDVADGSRPRSIAITQPGGVVGDIALMVDDYPQFSAGETCVLFLGENNQVIGGNQGKLDVVRGRVSEYDLPTGQLGDRVRSSRIGQKVPRRRGAPETATPPLAAPSARTSSASAGQTTVPVQGAATASAAAIAFISPSKAIAGVDSVTINGAGFGTTQGTGAVYFNSGLGVSGGRLAATEFLGWSDSSIVCRVPVNASSGTVYVRNGAGAEVGYNYDTSFSTQGFRWGTMPATYRVNEDAPMIGEASQVQAAMGTWNAVSQNLQLAYAPVAIAAGSYPSAQDGVNSVQFAVLPSYLSGSLAVNYYWVRVSTKTILESDIYFNSIYNWGSDASGGVFDLQTVALHELGHTVGLDDQYPNTWRTMGAYTGTNRRALSADEIAGVTYLYGAVSPVNPPTDSSVDGVPAAETLTVYRFYNRKQGVHFYTADPTEKQTVIDHHSDVYSYEGAAYSINSASASNSRPLYRFFNVKKGVHFYTASEAERDSVARRFPATYRYEGVAYSVCVADPPEGSSAVYRFYNRRQGVHFYTADPSEKQNVAEYHSNVYSYEGVGFHLAP